MWYMGREILDWILEDLGEPKEMVNVFIMEVVCWSVTLRFSVIVQGAYSTFKEREQSHRGMFNRLGRATKSWRWTGFAMFLQSGFRIPPPKSQQVTEWCWQKSQQFKCDWCRAAEVLIILLLHLHSTDCPTVHMGCSCSPGGLLLHQCSIVFEDYS